MRERPQAPFQLYAYRDVQLDLSVQNAERGLSKPYRNKKSWVTDKNRLNRNSSSWNQWTFLITIPKHPPFTQKRAIQRQERVQVIKQYVRSLINKKLKYTDTPNFRSGFWMSSRVSVGQLDCRSARPRQKCFKFENAISRQCFDKRASCRQAIELRKPA